METYAWPDGCLKIRWKGISLPYRVFDPAQQRVTHATITENKRLSETLAWIMAQQAEAAPEIGPVGKQRSRYTPTGKRGGRKGWVALRAERRAAEAEAAQAKLNQTLPPAE